MTTASNNRRAKVFLKRLAIVIRWTLVLVVLVFVSAATVGLPQAIVQRIERGLSNEAFVIELGRVRINILSGVHVNRIKLFRRHALGPAILDAEHVLIRGNLLNGLFRKPIFEKVSLGGGMFRPLMIGSLEAASDRHETGEFSIGVELDDVSVEGVTLNAFTARLSRKDGSWYCRSADTMIGLGKRVGQISGDAEYRDAGKFSARLKSECDPGILIPIIQAGRMHGSAEIIGRFEFSSVVPVWTLDVVRQGEDDPAMVTTIDFHMEDLAYSGIPLQIADGGLSISRSASNIATVAKDFLLVRENELLQGGFTLTSGPTRTNATYEATSTFHPYSLTKIIGVWTNLENEGYQFQAPFKINVAGQSEVGRKFGTDEVFNMSFGEMSVGRVDIQNCEFAFYVEGSSNRIVDLSGEWCGGELKGSMTMQFPHDDQTNKILNLAASVANASFENVVTNVFDAPTRNSGGNLSGNVTLERVTDSALVSTTRGKGDLRVTDGRLLRLQLFGGLSDYVARMIPAVDVVMNQTDFKTAFEIENDVIHTDKVLLEGSLLSLTGKGNYKVNGELDFNVNLKLLKSHTLGHYLISIPTFLFSKLFEFKLSGTRDEPKWYPVNFSSDIFERFKGGEDEDASEE